MTGPAPSSLAATWPAPIWPTPTWPRTMRSACAVAMTAMVFATCAACDVAWPAETLPTADVVPNLTPNTPPDDPAVQARPPGCETWTDRCVTCRHVAGAVTCSNIGLACQPQAVQCLVPTPPPDDKKPDDKARDGKTPDDKNPPADEKK